MTVDEINAKVQEIFLARFDDEKAHNMEDHLLVDVLTAIAEDPTNAAEKAQAALRSTMIEFSRWTA
jgi:hypothetical protein